MKHYMVFLKTGESVHVWAEDFHWKDTGVLTFEVDDMNVALFNTNNICGMIKCKEGEEE